MIAGAAGVLVNDGDGDGDLLSVALLTPPATGAVTMDPDGSFTYTPASGFVGTDMFDYEVSDGLASATAMVSITITNAAPVSDDDSYIAYRNQALIVSAPGVLAGDPDADGDSLTAVLVIAPTNGTLALSTTGSFSYTPDPGYLGPDAFAYRSSDGVAVSSPSTVQIDVTNRKPVAVDDAATIASNGVASAAAPGLLANDIDLDGDALVALLGTSPLHGTALIQANGSWSYQPDAGFTGTDTFTYVAFDGLSTSLAATIRVTVVAAAPTATPDPTPAPSIEGPTPSPTIAAPAEPSASASPNASPGPTPSSTPVLPVATPVPGSSPPSGGSTEPFSLPDAGTLAGAANDLGMAAAGLGGLNMILWAVPSLILSVPGLLLVITIVAQAAGGLAWLPVARRKLGAFGLRNGSAVIRRRAA